MTQRERILLAAVVSVLVIIISFYGTKSVSKSFATKRDKIDKLKSDLEIEELNIERGFRAVEQISYWEERALSSGKEEAQRLYKAWINDWANRNGLQDLKLKVDPTRDLQVDKQLKYRSHSFTVTGRTNLRNLTKMLYEFETAKQLHRMRNILVSPEGDKELELAMTIEALALPQAMDRTEITTDEDRVELLAKAGGLDAAQEEIFRRNLFGPENNAPRLGVSSTYRVYLNDSLTIDLKGEDRDKVDRLEYNANLDELPGARLRSGKVEWRPREEGEFFAELEVRDDGYPSLFHKREVKIIVEKEPPPRPRDPPPPPKKFNFAKYTQLTAIIIKAGEPTAWLWVRPTDERLKVKVGDKFQIGEMEGRMTAMEYDHATFQSEGKIYEMRMRDFVGTAKVVGEVDTDESTAEQGEDGDGDNKAEQLLPPLESL